MKEDEGFFQHDTTGMFADVSEFDPGFDLREVAVDDSGDRVVGYKRDSRCSVGRTWDNTHREVGWIWKRTVTRQDALALSDADMILLDPAACSDEDVRTQFELRWPASHPLLTRLQFGNATVFVYDKESYRGDKTEEVVQLAIELGVVDITDAQHSVHWELETDRQSGRDALAAGVYVSKQRNGAPGIWAVHNEKVASRRLRKVMGQEERTKPEFIGVWEWNRYTSEISRVALDEIPGHYHWQDNGKRETAITDFKKTIAMVGLIYGDKAWRRTEGFQKLLVQWRERREVSRTHWERTCGAAVAVFDWLDEEMKCRRPRKMTLPRRRNAPFVPIRPPKSSS